MGVFATRMRVFRPSLCLTGLRSLPGRRLTTSSLGDAEMEVDMERTNEALDLSSTSLKDMRVEPIVQEQDDGGPVILGVKVSPKEKKETDSIGESWMRDRLKLEQTLQEESNAQVNDPQVIFDAVYADLCRKYNQDRDLVFPKEVIWLCGAPGSGKGTHAAQIMKQRGITAAPIVMSDLLISSESKKAKEEGRLVADGYVLERLLHEMIDPKFKQGVIVDGFPRNSFQTEFVRLLHQKMLQLREQHGRPFRRPAFRLAVLWVPESVSVHRQLQRGMEAKRENEERVRQGLEPLQDVERATDFDESKAQERYRTFRNNYEVILELQRSFHFTVVDATPSRQEVAKALEKEFQYQSSLELDVDTYGMIDHIPTVAGISMHARQLLVKRLDAYAARQKPLLQQAVAMIEAKMVPAIKRASISGRAAIRVNHPDLVRQPILVDMILDVLSDRGFHCYVEPITKSHAKRINLETGEIHSEESTIHRFFIEFPKSIIRASNRIAAPSLLDQHQ